MRRHWACSIGSSSLLPTSLYGLKWLETPLKVIGRYCYGNREENVLQTGATKGTGPVRFLSDSMESFYWKSQFRITFTFPPIVLTLPAMDLRGVLSQSSHVRKLGGDRSYQWNNPTVSPPAYSVRSSAVFLLRRLPHSLPLSPLSLPLCEWIGERSPPYRTGRMSLPAD